MNDSGASFKKINLNMLLTLDAILKFETLTLAGREVLLTQPAMSMALRRLRCHFDDPLVVYAHGKRTLTPLGEILRPRIARIIREAGDAFCQRPDFDPAATRRTVSLSAPPDIELMFLRTVVPRLMSQNANLNIRLVPFAYNSIDTMFNQGVDVAIVPGWMAETSSPSQYLFEDRLAGIVDREHPGVGDALSLDQYLGARHAALFEGMEPVNLDESAQEVLAKRNIVVRTSLYPMLPALVEGTELIATISSWLAQYYASITSVRLVSVPLGGKGTAIRAQWPIHLDKDPYIAWLLQQLTDAIFWHHHATEPEIL